MNIIVFTVMILFTPGTAFAYLDPGTGSLIIQAVIGALAVVAVFWRQTKAYIRSFFSTNKPTSPSVTFETGAVNDKHPGTEEKDEHKQ